MKKIILTAIASVFIYTLAMAQAPDPDTTARHFVIMASIGNLQEVSAGQLAEQKSSRADVRAFAKMMVDDHSQAEQKLMQLAKSKNMNIPPEATGGMTGDHRMKKATGNFDNMYVHSMLAGHRMTVQMFENYAVTGKDPELKAFARQTLPTLKAHLAAIETIDRKLNTETK